jgi:general secretion pathway protein B
VSSILDALKKSEADRQRAAGPTLLEMRVQPHRRRVPAWVIALGVLLLGNVALLVWLALRHAPAVAAATAPNPPATIAPAAAAPFAPASGALAPVRVPAPTVAPTTMPALPAAPAAAPVARGAAPPVADGEDNPADEAPAVEPAPRRGRASHQDPNVQSYGALSATLPPLHLDLHFWSDVPAERYALINLHRVGEGDTLPEGPHIIEITRDGVVMDYQGREFVLNRE